ncbi:hypothetical protein SDC9_181370 [bioreactor metagenome]|uniref:Uncharacterized protein n=1 Tax=bioreactor metagenome TaxID=1076179 RepID=A0A645H4D1_9ZZZZ
MKLKVKIDKKRKFLFVERLQFIGVILKKRSGIVCRQDSIPVQVPPVAVIGNADLFHPALCRSRFFDGNAQWGRVVGTYNVAPVPVRLLLVVFVNFDNGVLGAKKNRIVFDGSQVERGKQTATGPVHFFALLNNLFHLIFPLSQPLSFSRESHISIGCPTI